MEPGFVRIEVREFICLSKSCRFDVHPGLPDIKYYGRDKLLDKFLMVLYNGCI